MPPIQTTRTLLELRVGSSHTIEALVQLRHEDIPWWNSNLALHERELYKLIGRRVIPSECREEIETFRQRLRERETAAAAANDDYVGGGKKKKLKKSDNIVIGEANLKKAAATEKNPAAKTAGRKRGRQSAKNAATKNQQSSAVAKIDNSNPTNPGKDPNEGGTETKEKKLKLLREEGTWIMGTSIQICYKIEDIDKSSAATLVFRPKMVVENSSPSNSNKGEKNNNSKIKENNDPINDDGEGKLIPLASFRKWRKIPKRINLWVFRFDPENPTDLSTSEGGGFPRPELLPLSDIFRSSGDDDFE
ncbi:hypothetical protein ACHAXS_014164 [Conticribra weissflogii]